MAGGTHLELEEQERLAALKAEGLSLWAMAGRSAGRPSTVSRELRRNALPKGGYLPVHAEGCYRERRQRQAVLERDERLGRFVRECLLEGWTPEQIAGWLKRGEERGLRPRLRPRPLYAFVHRAGQKAKEEALEAAAARPLVGLVGRIPPSPSGARSTTGPRTSKSGRTPGHWEGDLLICKRTRPVLVLEEPFGRRGVRPPPLAAVPFGCTHAGHVRGTRNRVSFGLVDEFRDAGRSRSRA